jgi:hypothetical protein
MLRSCPSYLGILWLDGLDSMSQVSQINKRNEQGLLCSLLERPQELRWTPGGIRHSCFCYGKKQPSNLGSFDLMFHIAKFSIPLTVSILQNAREDG